jgi:hypothetical protein
MIFFQKKCGYTIEIDIFLPIFDKSGQKHVFYNFWVPFGIGGLLEIVSK